MRLSANAGGLARPQFAARDTGPGHRHPVSRRSPVRPWPDEVGPSGRGDSKNTRALTVQFFFNVPGLLDNGVVWTAYGMRSSLQHYLIALTLLFGSGLVNASPRPAGGGAVHVPRLPLVSTRRQPTLES